MARSGKASLADLVILFRQPRVEGEGDTRRVSASAEVTYRPPGKGRGVDGQPAVAFVSPLGPEEARDLRWYLEAYGIWPFGVFKDRAQRIEASLLAWGRKLHDAVLGRPEARPALDAWTHADRVERRITIKIQGGGDPEAAAMILALPWELIADERGYLFEGALRARVRRTLASEHAMKPASPRLPLRVLLVLARPDDERGSFIDPRVTAIPLAEAIAPLGDAVELTVLQDGTFKALREALDAADREGRPYQVVHFDGHGVYDKVRGLGQLCFENADDAAQGKIDRGTDLVDASRIGDMLRQRRVPLFVLEACQSATTETNPTASVAATLLQAGVASVVAMSHAVLVETARRFVPAFYGALAEGDRIGAAMVRAQHALKDDAARGQVAAMPRAMHDWMVPVLFQEDQDPRLFPNGVDLDPAAAEARRLQAKAQRGDLPGAPAHGFVGRGKALLAIDRGLRDRRYVAITGGGGQGKTALAVEAAGWLLAMRRVDKVAFVSVEQISEARAVLDVLGRQLVSGYSVAMAAGTGTDEEKRRRALAPVERELVQRRVLLVVDNLESVLPKAGEPVEEGTAELLEMIRGLSDVGRTRVILTSREAVPAPLDGNVAALGPLGRREATELLAGVLRAKGLEPRGGEGDKDAVEKLIDQVGGHARSLVLLGGLVAEKGARAVAEDVRGMMAELEARFPDQRERSLIASVRLSLNRLPEGVREKIRGLAVFRGGAHFMAIAQVLDIRPDDAISFGRELIAVGLADGAGPFLLPDPGIRAALLPELDQKDQISAERAWIDATVALANHLAENMHQDAETSVHGVRLAIVDMLEVLATLTADAVAGDKDRADLAFAYCNCLNFLLSAQYLPSARRRIDESRRSILALTREWSRASFVAAAMDVQSAVENGQLEIALERALALRDRCEREGDAYDGAMYDRALALWKVGMVLARSGKPDLALSFLDDAQERFSGLAANGDQHAFRMEGAVIAERGVALKALGRLEQAAKVLEQAADCARVIGDRRSLAATRNDLAQIRVDQGHYDDALLAFEECLEVFQSLNEPTSVARTWVDIGDAKFLKPDLDAAERSYRIALSIFVMNDNSGGEAYVLLKLGRLCAAQGRLEDAASHLERAVELYRELGDLSSAAGCEGNLGIVLRQMGRFDDARKLILSSLDRRETGNTQGGAWRTWWALEDLEREVGRFEAAQHARAQAMNAYRRYRTGGGEPTGLTERFIYLFAGALISSGVGTARSMLPPIDKCPEHLLPMIRVLYAVAAGSRDCSLADDPALPPLEAVELALLLEALPPALQSADPCPCRSGSPFADCHGKDG